MLATRTVLELGIRVGGIDVARQEGADRDPLIFFRQPTFAVGSVFFRRPGPDQWQGNVLSTHLRRTRHLADHRGDPYAAEPPITAGYDREGFRNPVDSAPWEIVVVGDSFTEAGYLSQSDLFSDVAATRLGFTSRNLGVSFTGTTTHNFYLAEYGASPRLRHAVLAFFEGNDIDDLLVERTLSASFERSGQRPQRSIEPQTSLLRYLQQRIAMAVLRARQREAGRPLGREAEFETTDGAVPVDFLYAPPPALPKKARRHLDAELAAWAATARSLGATPWLLYLPAKRRALDGALRFGDAAHPKFAESVPGTLPQDVAELARAHGIRFVDATPALSAHARAGRLPYNSILDTHLNALGSRVVGELLAEAIGDPL